MVGKHKQKISEEQRKTRIAGLEGQEGFVPRNRAFCGMTFSDVSHVVFLKN